jgi:transposase InsO family protein
LLQPQTGSAADAFDGYRSGLSQTTDDLARYLKDYANAWEAEDSLAAFFCFYSHEWIHQALGYRTPAEVYGARMAPLVETSPGEAGIRGRDLASDERRDMPTTF